MRNTQKTKLITAARNNNVNLTKNQGNKSREKNRVDTFKDKLGRYIRDDLDTVKKRNLQESKSLLKAAQNKAIRTNISKRRLIIRNKILSVHYVEMEMKRFVA